MIIGIEGTGSQDWGRTSPMAPQNMAKSFVRKILYQAKDNLKYYLIGPNGAGSDVGLIIGAGRKLVEAWARSPQNDDLVLVGYSRGAAYCLNLMSHAATLAPRKPIKALVLFDTVSRQAGPYVIPESLASNVQYCFHAYRNPAAGSRQFFENVHVSAPSPTTKLFRKMFFASHGGMGGLPWDSQSGERQGASATMRGPFGVSLKVEVNVSDEVIGQPGMAVGRALGAIESYKPKNPFKYGAPSAFFQDPLIMNSAAGPSDRNHLNIPATPVLTVRQDIQGSNEAGVWMWDHLRRYGILPGAASHSNYAPRQIGPSVGEMQRIP